MVFGSRTFNQDREEIELFPLLEDIIEELSCYEVEYREDLTIEGDPIVYPVYLVPQFTKICVKRYQIDEDTFQGYLALYAEEGMAYFSHHEDFLSIMDGNAKLTILRANETTCLSKLKSLQTHKGLGALARVTPHEVLMSPIRMSGEHYKVRPFRVEMCSPYMSLNLNLTPELPTFPFSTQLNERSLLRPLGAGNISMSKLGYLLHQMGIQGLPPHCSIACLGDGYGGFTAVLAALGNRTTSIIFNTKPAREDSIPISIIAQEVSEKTGARVIDDLIAQEYYDLTKVTTMERLEQHALNYHIITLDAEVLTPRDSSPEQLKEVTNNRSLMFKHVSILFLRKATKGSILIMKCYIKETLLWLPSLALLVPRCANCYIVRGKASAMDGELYIVCQTNVASSLMYRAEDTYPPTRVLQGLEKFLARYIRQAQEDIGNCDTLMCRATYPKIIRQLMVFLPLYGWSKLEEFCKITVPQHIQRATNERPHSWIKEVINWLSELGWNYVQELHGVFVNVDADVYSTLTHCFVVGNRYLTVRAFLTVAMLFQSNMRPYITKTNVETWFLLALDDFPTSLQLPTSITIYKEKNGRPTVHGIEFSGLLYWLQGIRWALTAISAGLIGGMEPDVDTQEFVYRV
uniref:Uncharacterized protein n=1 Tax=Canne point virus TaxID=2485866 RepID=A0A3G3BTC6_9VIRU|nr:hypothetical protein [Canne point virus]